MKQISTLVICGILAACSPQIRVYSDHDPGYDLATFKTFDWGQKENVEQGRNPLHYNELNDKRIKSAVRQELENRGYTYSELAPELVIHYHIVVDNQSIIATEPFGYHYGSYWTEMKTDVHAYREGTLIVDIMDTRTNNLVWRGWATSDINGAYNAAEIEKLIMQAVSKIFRKFPGTANRVIDMNNRIAN